MRSAIDKYHTRGVPRGPFTKLEMGSCKKYGQGPFVNLREPVRHFYMHLGIAFQCDFCELLIAGRDALKRHIKHFHRKGFAAFEKDRKEREPPVS